MGKAVCENLSFCASSFSAATGPVHNPYAHGFTTGGSSPGCGALVGSGVVDGGIGGDQGGSIRFHASSCGIVGLKPTNGLVPYTGALLQFGGALELIKLGISTHDPVHDTTGPMTKTVAENARVLQAIAGRDGIDDRQYAAPLPSNLPNYSASLSKGVKGLKIGILKEAFEFSVMDPRVKEKMLAAANMFTALGADVIEASVPIHRVAGSLGECSITPVAALQGYLGKACGRRGLYMNSLVEKKVPLTQEKFDKVSRRSQL
jgi:amidase